MSVKGYKSSVIRGKLRVCDYLKAAGGLRQHVPDTVRFNKANLERMTASYSALYVKPDIGSQGVGIYKLKRKKSGYRLKWTSGKSQLSLRLGSIAEVHNKIASSGGGGKIIQQAIQLDKVNGKSYDIRVMVQRKPGGSWVRTGFLIKVGAPGKIVTNYFQGGQIYTMGRLAKELGLSDAERERRSAKLTSVALAMAKTLSRKKSGMHEMGIDFAYDRKGRIWVLEVNSNHPQFHPLKKLDRDAYRKMMSFAASYGRYSAK